MNETSTGDSTERDSAIIAGLFVLAVTWSCTGVVASALPSVSETTCVGIVLLYCLRSEPGRSVTAWLVRAFAVLTIILPPSSTVIPPFTVDPTNPPPKLSSTVSPGVPRTVMPPSVAAPEGSWSNGAVKLKRYQPSALRPSSRQCERSYVTPPSETRMLVSFAG